jgi:hypothetical protein
MIENATIIHWTKSRINLQSPAILEFHEAAVLALDFGQPIASAEGIIDRVGRSVRGYSSRRISGRGNMWE